MLALIRLLLLVSRPGSLVITVLTFSLGAGIADFLGQPVEWTAFYIGLAASLLLVFSSQMLDVYFRSLNGNLPAAIDDLAKQADSEITPVSFRRLVLQTAITMLTIGAVFTVLLLAQDLLTIPALIILGTAFVLAFFFAVPPLSISQKGVGEIIEAILLVNLISAFSFMLQYGQVHRLLVMVTLPLTCLLLAMRLALALPKYGEDMIKNNENMMTSVGWEKGIQMHNLLIIAAYALVAVAFLFGLPWRLVWPMLLTIPVAFYQIWQMRQISLGVKPNWSILRLTAITLFGLTAYLITISLWIG